MRRLFVLLALLLIPATARADGIDPPAPPLYYFSGCSNAVTGCISGTIEPWYRPDMGWLYRFAATCEVACVPYRLDLYGADANRIYSYDNGDYPGGRPIDETPTFGIVQLGAGAGYAPVAITTTPEPATLILLGSGLAGVAIARRRSRRHDDGHQV